MGRPPNASPKKVLNNEIVDSSPKAIILIFTKFLQDQADFYRQQSKRFAQISESLAALDRKRKRKHDIDPDAPKKPDNAYILFVKEQQKKLKEEFPNLDSRGIFVKIAGIWGQTTEDEKMQYSHRAEYLKNQYMKEMEDYNVKKSEGLLEIDTKGTPQGTRKVQSWTQTPPPPPLPQFSTVSYEEMSTHQSPGQQNYQERVMIPSNSSVNVSDQQQQHYHNQEEMMNQYNRSYYPHDDKYNQSYQQGQQIPSNVQLESNEVNSQHDSQFHDYDDENDSPRHTKKQKI